jgi:hypothetical protein
MASNFMSPLPVFTLESLIAQGQWSAAQSQTRRKNSPRREMRPLRNALSHIQRQKPAKTEA